MDNSLYVEQNELLLKRCLVAQREKYSRAEKFECCSFILILLSIVLYYFALSFQCQIFDAITTLLNVLFVIIENKLTKESDNLKKQAADIQQFFDCTLFSKILNTKIGDWGNVLTNTTIAEYTSEIDSCSVKAVENWYSDYSSESVEKQVFYAQAENVRWSKRLKKRAVVFLCSVFIFSFFAFLGDARNAIHGVMAIVYASWFLPVIVYFWDLLNAINKDITILEFIEKEQMDVEHSIRDLDESINVKQLINIQKNIYEYRSKGILIFDWYYKSCREKYENCEIYIADSLCSNKKLKN